MLEKQKAWVFQVFSFFTDKGGLTRNYLNDTICMTLIRILYDSINLNVLIAKS